jgi:HJR/Mrr/RecB family endonuclease
MEEPDILSSLKDSKKEKILLNYLATNQTSKSGVRKPHNKRIKKNFENWMKKLYGYNLTLLDIQADVKDTQVFQELKDSEGEILRYDKFEEDKEALQENFSGSNYLTVPETELTDEQITALRFAKAFLQSGKETYSGDPYTSIQLEGKNSGMFSYRKTNLTEFTRILNSKFNADFEERSGSFNQVESRGNGHITNRNYTTGLGDRLVESEYAYYDFYNSAKDNLSLFLQLREEKIRSTSVEPLVDDFEDLEGEDIESNFSRLGFEDFEELVSLILAHEGYDTKKTAKSGDYGADVVGENKMEKVVAQVKLNKTSSTGVKAVRQASSARDNLNCNKALAVTSSRFSTQAIDEAERQDVELWEGSEVAEKIEKYGIDLDEEL